MKISSQKSPSTPRIAVVTTYLCFRQLHAIYYLCMADFLKFIVSLVGAEQDAKKPDLKALMKELGGLYPCEPGALYQAGNCVSGQYEVVGELGKGGNGIVYLVLRLSDKQFCALKTFRDEFLASAVAREAFKRELSVWVNLGKHPTS
jgi:serine/threonine protein kinase